MSKQVVSRRTVLGGAVVAGVAASLEHAIAEVGHRATTISIWPASAANSAESSTGIRRPNASSTTMKPMG